MSDKKMYYVKNIEEIESGNTDCNICEYELQADSFLVGNFSHELYDIMLWDFVGRQAGEYRKLILRIKEAKKPLDLSKSHKNAYYHGGGIADEIVSLSSLFLRRRIKLIHRVRENDKPIIIPEKGYGWKDNDLISGQTNLKTLSYWFNLIEGLDDKYHQKFILATRLYHRSILMLEDDPDLAYLTLVSSIESLCQDHPLKKEPTLLEISPDLNDEIDMLIDDETSKARLKNMILKKNRFISRRFVAFILFYTDSEFWNNENRSEYGQIEENDLEAHLKNIYNQRSQTLHNGEAFPPMVFYPPTMNEEICLGLDMMYRERKWNEKDFIPNIHFFERLVNHVLKNFLKQNQVNK